jgi:hypothetical protein
LEYFSISILKERISVYFSRTNSRKNCSIQYNNRRRVGVMNKLTNTTTITTLALLTLLVVTTTTTTVTMTLIPAAYATSTTPSPPWVIYEEMGEEHQQFINATLEQVKTAILEHPEDVRITFYPREPPNNTTMTIVYDNGTSREFDDDTEVRLQSNVTEANGYTFEDFDTILKPDETRLFP